MSEELKLNKKDRYLEKMKDGRIFIWTKRLAMRNDMQEFDPEFDKDGSLIKRKNTIERMSELEEENVKLRELLKSATKPETTDETVSVDESLSPPEEEEIILPDLEDELDDGKVTEEFLMTKSADELRKFAFDVFQTKLNSLKKAETLIKDILELQKQMDI